MKPKVIASDFLLEALQRHHIHLSLLVADTGLWVSPKFHARLLRGTGSAAIFPKIRRVRIGQGEKRGQIIDGVRLDDNSYANLAIKRAAGLGKSAIGFEACHVWPRTCYDERYHTAPANIVLLPRALASLSDHDVEVQKALQFRAFELYNWWPQEMPRPVKPDFYPLEWREPQPDTTATPTPPIEPVPTGESRVDTFQEKHRVLASRIVDWSRKPDLNVHKIVNLVVQARGGIKRDELVRRVGEITQSKNPYGAVASLLTDSGNAYGRVFADYDGIIHIHPEVETLVGSLTWNAGQTSTPT